jgi:biotin operon repressor
LADGQGLEVYVMSLTRVPPDGQCRHSREPFDASFRCITERRDIGPAAKLVHAHLVTLHRTRRDATQTEIGDALGMSRHQVWRAVGELVTAGLVQTIRYGLGRPNGYVLLGVNEDDLAGRASGRRPAGGAVAGRVRPRARDYSSQKERRPKNGYTYPPRAGSLLETRYGRYVRPQ